MNWMSIYFMAIDKLSYDVRDAQRRCKTMMFIGRRLYKRGYSRAAVIYGDFK